MRFKRRTVEQLADLICGSAADGSVYRYRSSSYLTDFFADVGTGHTHDGSTRKWWVADTIETILAEPSAAVRTPPESFCRVIATLMDQHDAQNEAPTRPEAMLALNSILAREGFEAFYGEDRICYLRDLGSGQPMMQLANPHRPFSAEELRRRELLVNFLNICSEDQLLEEFLMPMFRQIGFHRLSLAGHKDKSLEYGKDLWMRFVLPTQHVLYFGLQAKIGKIDAAGRSANSNANIAEILNQVTMMLGHEVFDQETSRRVLVDHAFIVSAGEITKAARNWLGTRLDASKRSQILFMDRDDLLNLFVVTNTPLPHSALPSTAEPFDEIPF